jgi:hypothetical protein
MTEYIEKQTPEGRVVILKDDTLWIPSDPDNTDYQDYLAWLAEGNEPEVVKA